MEIISYPTHDEIKKAAKALKDGHLVAFPTETVYGLGADATNEKAVSRIYSVKGRPINHPLIVHISSISQLDKWAIYVPDYAVKLATKFWPGPMTLILKRSELAKNYITGGQNNVGLRVPEQHVALELLSEFEKIGGTGIAAPSANRFGAVSPTSAEAVSEELHMYLGKEDLILDGGECTVGIESTIIDCTKFAPTVLRPGIITSKKINSLFGLEISNKSEKNDIKTPGLLESHYCPLANVILEGPISHGDGFLAMADVPTPYGAVRLGSPNTLEQFAKELYSTLRLCDKKKISTIKIIQPEGEGLADAIRDRLHKSASRKK